MLYAHTRLLFSVLAGLICMAILTGCAMKGKFDGDPVNPSYLLEAEPYDTPRVLDLKDCFINYTLSKGDQPGKYRIRGEMVLKGPVHIGGLVWAGGRPQPIFNSKIFFLPVLDNVIMETIKIPITGSDAENMVFDDEFELKNELEDFTFAWEIHFWRG